VEANRNFIADFDRKTLREVTCVKTEVLIVGYQSR